MDFNFECTKLLENDVCKQRYITSKAIIPGQDRIYPKIHLCRTFLLYCHNILSFDFIYNDATNRGYLIFSV